MDPRRSAQDVLLCDACANNPLQIRCELCYVNLCFTCVGNHLSDSSRNHRVVPFKEISLAPCYPKCLTHSVKHCELYCEECDIPICSICISSGQHEGHKKSDVLEKLSSTTKDLRKDLEELETRIYPRYEEMARDVQTEISELKTKYGKLTLAVDQQGEILHQRITTIVNQRKSDIGDMKNKHMAALTEHTEEITRSITEINQTILDLKAILKSNDVSQTCTYRSRNDNFRKLPLKVKITIPSLSLPIHTENLNEMIGSLSSLYIIREENGSTMTSPEAVSSPPVKPLLDEPQLTATINARYEYGLSSVCSLSEKQIWTCGNNKILKLLNLRGKVLTSIKSKSGNAPKDIIVTPDRDLIYTDTDNKTVNLVKNKQIRAVITLQEWTLLNVCITSSSDLLVTMDSDDEKQSKVVRYSGSTEIQTIQFDDQDCPLYSSAHYTEYIAENKNLDICVADYDAKAVVVVNQLGKLRFQYTGHPSNTEESFNPVGITTDSQGHILTADYSNDRIHVLDQDGQFLRYIHNLRAPHGLCVDSKDNLFVAEYHIARVKKFQYLHA